jgi:type III secretion protein J
MAGAQGVFSFRNLSTAANRWLWMFCILALAGCGKVELYSGLPEAEANRMTAILDQNGIAVSKTAGAENTFIVMVDRQDFARAVDLMHNNGFPRGQFTNIGEVFQKSGMVSSPTEDRIRFMYALSQSLSETISQIDGVVTARVHIVLPEEKPLTETYFPASAAVFVKVQPESRVSDLRSEIKQLVANSIEGMKYDNVSLVLVPAEEMGLSRTTPVRKNVIAPWMVWGGFGALAVLSLAAFAVLSRPRRTSSPASDQKALPMGSKKS